MRITTIVQSNKNLGRALSPYSILPLRIFSRNEARKTAYIRQSRRFKPVILYLSPECQQAIALNIFSTELSCLVDVAIVQAEARYALEFMGVAS